MRKSDELGECWMSEIEKDYYLDEEERSTLS